MVCADLQLPGATWVRAEVIHPLVLSLCGGLAVSANRPQSERIVAASSEGPGTSDLTGKYPRKITSR